MGLYDGIKDVAKILQEADNIDLYKKLLELSAQALEMQNKIDLLTLENKKMKDVSEITNKIERHSETYVTLNDDDKKIHYCSRCWDKDKNLVQIAKRTNNLFVCPDCNNKGTFNNNAQTLYTAVRGPKRSI